LFFETFFTKKGEKSIARGHGGRKRPRISHGGVSRRKDEQIDLLSEDEHYKPDTNYQGMNVMKPPAAGTRNKILRETQIPWKYNSCVLVHRLQIYLSIWRIQA